MVFFLDFSWWPDHSLGLSPRNPLLSEHVDEFDPSQSRANPLNLQFIHPSNHDNPRAPAKYLRLKARGLNCVRRKCSWRERLILYSKLSPQREEKRIFSLSNSPHLFGLESSTHHYIGFFSTQQSFQSTTRNIKTCQENSPPSLGLWSFCFPRLRSVSSLCCDSPIFINYFSDRRCGWRRRPTKRGYLESYISLHR